MSTRALSAIVGALLVSCGASAQEWSAPVRGA